MTEGVVASRPQAPPGLAAASDRRRADWEEARRRVLSSLAGLTLAPFAGGLWMGIFFAPLLWVLTFAFAFELSRPVSPHPQWDRRWALVVYGLMGSAIPGIWVALAWSTGMLREPETVRGVGGDVVLLYAVSTLVASGCFLASVHVVRRRGTAWEARAADWLLWAAPVGFAWWLVWDILGDQFPSMGGTITVSWSVVGWPGGLVAFGGGGALLAWAWARTWSPAQVADLHAPESRFEAFRPRSE